MTRSSWPKGRTNEILGKVQVISSTTKKILSYQECPLVEVCPLEVLSLAVFNIGVTPDQTTVYVEFYHGLRL